MVERKHRSILANASANVLRLVGSGIVALALPPFLVRVLPTDAYSAWALLMQWVLWVGFLDFGIQIAVARFVAHADELNKDDERDGVASTAFALLAGACILGFFLVGLLAWQFPHVFRTMPWGLQREGRVALLIVGGSLALGLPAAVFPALFVGLQRNEVPAVLSIGNKVVMAVLVIAAALKHLGLGAMATGVALSNLIYYGVSWLAWRAWAHRVRIRLAFVTTQYARQIAAYSSALTVWSGAMLLISGLDLTIVGIFDYRVTAAYAVAATLTNVMAQTQGAIFAAFLPASAVLSARGDDEKLGAMLLSSTRYGCVTLLLMGLPLLVAGNLILRIWVGSEYAAQGTAILQILVAANMIRLIALPYSTLLLGTGQQQKVILSPLAEGATNLVASVVGAYYFGAIGVAIGTLIGSIVSIAFHFLYNMPRTSAIAIDRPLLVREGCLRPFLCAIPLGLVLLLHLAVPQFSAAVLVAMAAAGLLGSLCLLWNYGLFRAERNRLQHVLRIA